MNGLLVVALFGVAARLASPDGQVGVPLGGGVSFVEGDAGCGLVDGSGAVLIPLENQFITMRRVGGFSSTVPIVLRTPDGGGLVVTSLENGKPVLTRYDELQVEKDGPAKAWVVRRGDKWGVLGEDGRELLAPIYDRLTEAEGGGQAGFRSFSLNGKRGLVALADGRVELSASYDALEPTADFYWPRAAKRDGKWGLVDERDVVVAPFTYDEIAPSGSVFPRLAERAGKHGLLDRKGREVAPVSYDTLRPVENHEHLYVAERDGKWGFIDDRGRTVVGLKYDRIEGPFGAYARVAVGGRLGWIDLRGRKVDPLSPTFARKVAASEPLEALGASSEPEPVEGALPASVSLLVHPDAVPLTVPASGDVRELLEAELVNGTTQVFSPYAVDGHYWVIEEALDRGGAWQPLEYVVAPTCGLSTVVGSPVPAGQRRVLGVRRYRGRFHTKLRLALYTGEGFIESAPFEGSIDERQLEKSSRSDAVNLRDFAKARVAR